MFITNLIFGETNKSLRKLLLAVKSRHELPVDIWKSTCNNHILKEIKPDEPVKNITR